MRNYLQKLGRSIMLPVAILPVAAILMGIGYWIDPAGMSGEGSNSVAVFLIQAGLSIINNLPIIFAVGIATGIAKDNHGAAALSGLVAFLLTTHILSPDAISVITNTPVESVDPSFGAISNVFIAIISAIVAGEMYNRFSNTELPMALAFFSGKRLVPILTAVAMVVVSLILFFVWPIAYNALVSFGEAIAGLGALGAGIYGFFNRLLIPTGLHHALNSVFWFDLAGINDIGNFWASEGVQGITGRYQAGFFPVMMFGLPAAALAMYRHAKPERKKATASLMIAAAFASFFTGITEPLEFAFMFASPILYVTHALLTGLSMFIAAIFQWTAGFSFSAGLIDYILSLRIPIANQPLMLLVLGVIMFAVYFVVFNFMIERFDLKTPGREDEEVVAEVESNGVVTREDNIAGEPAMATATTGTTAAPNESVAPDRKYTAMARTIYEGLGGKDNISHIDNCATRLRLQVNDSSLVDQAKIKSTNVPAVSILDKENVHVIVGTNVQFVRDELDMLYRADS